MDELEFQVVMVLLPAWFLAIAFTVTLVVLLLVGAYTRSTTWIILAQTALGFAFFYIIIVQADRQGISPMVARPFFRIVAANTAFSLLLAAVIQVFETRREKRDGRTQSDIPFYDRDATNYILTNSPPDVLEAYKRLEDTGPIEPVRQQR